MSKAKSTPSTSTIQTLRKLKVTGAALASILGITPQAVSNAYQQGRIPRRSDGTYGLLDAVRAYIDDLRRQARHTESGDDPKAEYDYWRTELTKTKVASWVEARDQEVAVQLAAGLAPMLRDLGDLIREVAPDRYAEGLALLEAMEEAGLPGIVNPPAPDEEEDDGL